MNAATSVLASPVSLQPRWLGQVLARITRTWPDRAALNPHHVDASTSLLNSAGFKLHGDRALESCGSGGRALALAVFDCSDLLEVRAIYGTRIARMVMERTVAKLRGATPAGGFAARTGQAEFTLVMPGCNVQRARGAIQRAFGTPARVEMDAGHSEIVMVPEFRVDIAGTDTGTVDELRAELSREIEQARMAEQRRQRYMQRERESHSRPMAFPASGL